MHGFENDLKSALARRQPPEGFADRVMARISPPRQSRWTQSWMAAAAAFALAVLGGGVYEYQKAERLRHQGERARAELVFALEVASEKLHNTRVKIVQVAEDRL
jgi:hypothetical protein